MSVREIGTALSSAYVAAFKTAEGKRSEADVVFLSYERRMSLRRGREKMKTKDWIAEVKEGKLRNDGIRDLMQSRRVGSLASLE